MHVTATVAPVSPVIEPEPDLVEPTALPAGVQVFAEQVIALKVPAQVAVPEPLYPELQLTTTLAPVLPLIEPVVDMLEFAT